jgi:exopolysaccharide biosynthesis polyprenyl glycosylphosphotransferase
MIRLRHKLLISSYRIFDLLALVMTLYVVLTGYSFFASNNVGQDEIAVRKSSLLGLLLLTTCWFFLLDYIITYQKRRLDSFSKQVKSIFKATLAATLVLLVVDKIFSISIGLGPYSSFYFFLTSTGLIFTTRLSSRLFLHSGKGLPNRSRNLLFVGINDKSLQMACKMMCKPELGYKIIGFVSEENEYRNHVNDQDLHPWDHLGCLSELREILSSKSVDEIIINIPFNKQHERIFTIIKDARDLGVVVRISNNSFGVDYLNDMDVEELDDEIFVTFFREKLILQLCIKRLIDAFIAFITLIISFPLMVVVALVVKLTSPGPVFFIQNRVGMNQRIFRLYKFRSMVVDAEKRKIEIAHMNERDGPVFKISNDPRITWFGRFIRKTSIDEIPQLFNVLNGDMSLVGPRPPLPEEVDRYEWMFRKRLSVKPGITCIWQVSGRDSVSFNQWMKMDQEYVENWSIWLDLKILFKTIPAVLLSRGAS